MSLNTDLSIRKYLGDAKIEEFIANKNPSIVRHSDEEPLLFFQIMTIHPSMNYH